jgi:diaminopimelate epimerase
VTDVLLKVEGAGNDFVLGSGEWAGRLASDPELVTRLCHRRTGLGADGALAIQMTAADRVRLIYRNADGSLARFCGNGTRCAARAAVERLGASSRLVVETDWAPIPAEVAGSTVGLELPPMAEEPRHLALETGGRRWRGVLIRIGVPHLVVRVEDLEAIDLALHGPALRHHTQMAPDGANINFVNQVNDGELDLRTYERGVEGETLCCGSGVVAAAVVDMVQGGHRRTEVHVRSGDTLVVEALGDPLTATTRLTGPTRMIADLHPTPEFLQP